MKILGITGGIGMGKSTSADLLARRGIPVTDTDKIARELVEPGQSALQEIIQAFGSDIIDATGRLRRDELARRVFSNETLRTKLESILHPKIRSKWLKQMETWRAEGRPVAAVIIPLLFETGAQEHCDSTICVACTAASQQQRLLARGWSKEQIAQRLRAQWPTEKKIELADYIIWTEGPVNLHSAQLDKILSRNRRIRTGSLSTKSSPSPPWGRGPG